jgi:hypothetical protein
VNSTVKGRFLERWDASFPGAELPIVFSYTDENVPSHAETSGAASHCLICDLAAVREGATRTFDRRTLRCGGARRYLGFETEMRPNFLANLDEVDPPAVIAPFASGCSSIAYHPYQELRSDHPRAVLGMLTCAVPWPKFADRVDQMDESFLITNSWRKVRSRL